MNSRPKALRRRVAEAGIRTLAPHDGRRTWISNLLDVGGEVVVVQKLAGHADPKTTAGYDRRGDEVRVKAINRLAMPWHPAGSRKEEGGRNEGAGGVP